MAPRTGRRGYYRLIARQAERRSMSLAHRLRPARRHPGPHGGANQQWLLRRDRPRPPSTPADIVRFLEQATFGPTPDSSSTCGRRLRGIPRGAVPGAGLELPDAAPLPGDARHGDVPERLDVPARQLHDVPAAEPVLRQRALWRRPVAAARRVRTAPDHRRLGRRHHPAKLDGAVPADARSQRVRQLPRAALRHHPQPGDGQLPGHQRQHRTRRTKTTRARCCSCFRSAPFV